MHVCFPIRNLIRPGGNSTYGAHKNELQAVFHEKEKERKEVLRQQKNPPRFVNVFKVTLPTGEKTSSHFRFEHFFSRFNHQYRTRQNSV